MSARTDNLHARDRLDNNVAVQGEVTAGRLLPCGHRTRSLPISETLERAYYRCPKGCELQTVRKHV